MQVRAATVALALAAADPGRVMASELAPVGPAPFNHYDPYNNLNDRRRPIDDPEYLGRRDGYDPFNNLTDRSRRASPAQGGTGAIGGGSAISVTVRESERGDAAARTIVHARDFSPKLRTCWQPPDGAGAGSLVLRFALSRSGTLIAGPSVVSRSGSIDAALAASAVRAVESCAPFAFSERFARGIAGRPVAVRFVFN
jgi:hypothetical protein